MFHINWNISSQQSGREVKFEVKTLQIFIFLMSSKNLMNH